jgi:hypothetical protein
LICPKDFCQEENFFRWSVSLSSIYLGGKSPVIMKFAWLWSCSIV